jgi:DNA-binding NtrC family response regulator
MVFTVSEGKILIIDDEDIVLKSCYRALTPEGYDVRTAGNGVEGLSMLENEPFDIVMIDVKMPDMDGIELLTLIKEKWPETEVIMMTGYSDDTLRHTVVNAIKLGAFDYIEKPFTPHSISLSVQKALDKKFRDRGKTT